jgi:hypothetical protein
MFLWLFPSISNYHHCLDAVIVYLISQDLWVRTIYCWTGSSPGAAELHWLGVSMICIAMYYLEAILRSIISTIVFVCVRPNNRSELLYRSQTTLQHLPILFLLSLRKSEFAPLHTICRIPSDENNPHQVNRPPLRSKLSYNPGSSANFTVDASDKIMAV